MNGNITIREIFLHEKDILYSSKFVRHVVNRRLKRSYVDKNIINQKSVYINFEDIKDLKTGIYTTEICNAKFQFFFHKGSEKKLFVVLDGARTSSGGKKRDIPIYNRWSFYNLTNASWISLEDPMYFKYEDLLLGWFYGDKSNDFRYYTSLLIEKIVNILKINHENVVFYGGSGGGTAALDVATKFGNCTAVSINGQYNFEYNHDNIKDFFEKTGIDLHKNDIFNRNNILNMLGNDTVKYIFIENCKSKWDYRDHLSYVCDKLNIKPRLGISKFNNIYMYIYEANGKFPHTSFEDRVLFYVIDFIIKLANSNSNIEDYKSLFLLFNEFWYYKYQTDNVLSIEYINDDNFITQSTQVINNIKIDSGIDKYCCYNVLLKCNKKYKISIHGINLNSKDKEITIGVYSPTLHDFIISDIYNINNIIDICLKIKGEASDLQFCIFSGIHGATQNRVLSIDRIEIFESGVNV